ncbi:glycosyl hydrolase [Endogone sp. FLAS-F59071]|nr:glycosyl hydrolase [Endogone sp. FLAS-F59071]|eukprot:RUS18048.1 glycosyl hydrolase [Endogone sp. FLAS-F59071]
MEHRSVDLLSFNLSTLSPTTSCTPPPAHIRHLTDFPLLSRPPLSSSMALIPSRAVLLALLLFALALPSFAATATTCSNAQQFHNPVLTANSADPWVIRHEGFFFMTRTAADQRSVIVLRSTLLHVWDNATTVEVYRPTNPNGTVHAPELHLINNQWYIYFGGESIVPGQEVGIRKLFVLQGVWFGPLGPYKFLGQMIFKDPASDLWAGDPTIYTYPADSQTTYLLWSGRDTNDDPSLNIYIASLTAPLTVTSSRIEISQADYAWEKHGEAINEAPQVLVSPQYDYYIVYSASASWTGQYALGLISIDVPSLPLDPDSYTKYTQAFFSSSATDGVHSPGGATFLEAVVVNPPTATQNRTEKDRQNWIFYSARDTSHTESSTNPVTGRTIRAQEFTWNDNDEPVLGVPIANRTCTSWPAGDGVGFFFGQQPATTTTTTTTTTS